MLADDPTLVLRQPERPPGPGQEERPALTQALMCVLNDQRPAEFALRIGGQSQPALRARAVPIVVGNRATGIAISVFPPRQGA
mgnify:CR=1 FL=1